MEFWSYNVRLFDCSNVRSQQFFTTQQHNNPTRTTTTMSTLSSLKAPFQRCLKNMLTTTAKSVALVSTATVATAYGYHAMNDASMYVFVGEEESYLLKQKLVSDKFFLDDKWHRIKFVPIGGTASLSYQCTNLVMLYIETLRGVLGACGFNPSLPVCAHTTSSTLTQKGQSGGYEAFYYGVGVNRRSLFNNIHSTIGLVSIIHSPKDEETEIKLSCLGTRGYQDATIEHFNRVPQTISFGGSLEETSLLINDMHHFTNHTTEEAPNIDGDAFRLYGAYPSEDNDYYVSSVYNGPDHETVRDLAMAAHRKTAVFVFKMNLVFLYANVMKFPVGLPEKKEKTEGTL